MKISELLEYGVSILERQLNHLSNEVDNGPLEYNSAQTLNQCIRTLVMAAKGQSTIEEAESVELEKYTEEELVKMAEEALKEVKGKKHASK